MLRIAIVDDEAPERERLKQYILKRLNACGRDASFVLYKDGLKLVEDAPRNLDILFLDIQMDGMNGIQAAKEIRRYDEDVPIIYITNMAQYAIEGYSVNALDYLLKPVDETAVARTVDKALKRLEKKTPAVVSLRGIKERFVLKAAEICYIETYDRKLMVHMVQGETILCNETLQAIEERLPGCFFRCHGAFLVNLRLVERIAGSDIVAGGVRIPLSKHRKKEFMQAMTAYVKERFG